MTPRLPARRKRPGEISCPGLGLARSIISRTGFSSRPVYACKRGSRRGSLFPTGPVRLGQTTLEKCVRDSGELLNTVRKPTILDVEIGKVPESVVMMDNFQKPTGGLSSRGVRQVCARLATEIRRILGQQPPA